MPRTSSWLTLSLSLAAHFLFFRLTSLVPCRKSVSWLANLKLKLKQFIKTWPQVSLNWPDWAFEKAACVHQATKQSYVSTQLKVELFWMGRSWLSDWQVFLWLALILKISSCHGMRRRLLWAQWKLQSWQWLVLCSLELLLPSCVYVA